MKPLFIFLIIYNLLISHVFAGKNITASDYITCPECDAMKEKTNQCPAILSTLIEDDKEGRLFGLKKSHFKKCTQNLESKNYNFSKIEDLQNFAVKYLGPKASMAIINNLNKCSKKDSPDSRIIIGKGAYSLLRLEKGQSELYNQIASADFIIGNEILKDDHCSDIIFNSLENQCINLKNSCFQDKNKERNNLFLLSKQIEANVKTLEKDLKDKSLSKEIKTSKESAMTLLKLKYPWVFGNAFKKARDHGNSVVEATISQFTADRKASLEKLKELQNRSLCFYDSASSFCRPKDITASIEQTPELELDVIDGNTDKEKNDQNFWYYNMAAQDCLVKSTDADHKGNAIIKEGFLIAGATALTAGLGALSEATLLARSAQATRAAAGVSFATQTGVDTYFAVSGVQNAFHACAGHDIQKINSSKIPAQSCPMMENVNNVSYSEQESCKLDIIMAVAGGIPLAVAVNQAGKLTKNPIVQKALEAFAKNTSQTLSKVAVSLGSTKQMITDRNVSQTLALFGNANALALEFNSVKPLKIATLGAGKGVSAEELARRGHHVTAVELDGKTEQLTMATAKGGSITRINGTDASRTQVLEHNSYDLFYETHGANAYTDRPDLLTQTIMDSLKKDGKYYAFGGGDADSWALNNKIILENGDVVNYIDWIKTIPGIKVEAHAIPGKLNEAGELISAPGSYFIITKISPEVKIPELKNIYREDIPKSVNRLVPHQTFKVSSSIRPKIGFPKIEGAAHHFVSQGLPTDQLRDLALKGKGAVITIAGGPVNGGILNSTKIRLKDGNEVSLDKYLEKIPGLKISFINRKETKRYVETRSRVKIFTGDMDEFKSNFRVTEKIAVEDLQVTVTDPKAVEIFLQKHNLELAGLGKPAPIKFDGTGNPVEQVRAPYFIEN